MDVIETFIESDSDEVDPLMTNEEEVGSSLKGREESSNLLILKNLSIYWEWKMRKKV